MATGLGNKKIKLPLFANDIIVCPEHWKGSADNTLKITKKFSKVAGYKTNIQLSVAFLFNRNKQPAKVIKKKTSFTGAQENSKCPGMKLMKDGMLSLEKFIKLY